MSNHHVWGDQQRHFILPSSVQALNQTVSNPLVLLIQLSLWEQKDGVLLNQIYAEL